jgi:hypothetical protein
MNEAVILILFAVCAVLYIAGMAVCALLLPIFCGNANAALVFAGRLLFIASDTRLAYSVFRAPLGNASVMLPYIAA